MSKALEIRVDTLEKRGGGGGGTIIAILDDREPLVDGVQMVKISNTGELMALDEFERCYPDGNLVIFRLKYDGDGDE